MENLRLLIIDDHALFRTGLVMILNQDDRIGETLEAGSVMEALELAEENIDLILLDIQMPGLNGLDGLKVLRQKFVATPILILSASGDKAEIERAEMQGAMGYLHKSVAAEEITTAIGRVLQGQRCFPGSLSDRTAAGGKEAADALTARQLEVLALLCEGKPNKVIARNLDMSENTARVHVSAILAHLGVTSRSEAILAAQRLGIIHRET